MNMLARDTYVLYLILVLRHAYCLSHLPLVLDLGTKACVLLVCFRMNLFFEKTSSLTERMFNLQVLPDDPENYVYTIPGLDAYGKQ